VLSPGRIPPTPKLGKFCKLRKQGTTGKISQVGKGARQASGQKGLKFQSAAAPAEDSLPLVIEMRARLKKIHVKKPLPNSSEKQLMIESTRKQLIIDATRY
jgi:hypothetical protein